MSEAALTGQTRRRSPVLVPTYIHGLAAEVVITLDPPSKTRGYSRNWSPMVWTYRLHVSAKQVNFQLGSRRELATHFLFLLPQTQGKAWHFFILTAP